MLNWLLEIFSDNSEKASLITTALTTAVALVVVYIAHRLTHVRARGELKTKKIEEIYATLRKFRMSGMKQIKGKLANQSPKENELEEYQESFEAMEMLAFLYMPSIEEDVKKMNMAVVMALEGKEFPFRSSKYTEFDNYSAFFLTHASSLRDELQKQTKKVA